MTVPDPTTLTILGGAVTGMTTAIGVLWKTVMSHLHKIEDKLQECEDDRKELWMVIAKQSDKDVEELKQRDDK